MSHHLTHILEAMLFASSEPVSLRQLAKAALCTPDQAEGALATLEASLSTRGIRLQSHGSTYQLITAPQLSEYVARFLEDRTRLELSRAALETLAIIAYRGPLTKLAIDDIRGVASDAMIRNLISRGLITETGITNEPGGASMYAVSHRFMEHFGLTTLEELPPLAQTEEAT